MDLGSDLAHKLAVDGVLAGLGGVLRVVQTSEVDAAGATWGGFSARLRLIDSVIIVSNSGVRHRASI